jgi:nitrous oxidase accessory protein NosD
MKLPSHLLPIIPLVASLMTAHAATHAVLPGTSIQAKINLAVARDIVAIFGGTYNEDITINKATPFSPPSGPAQRLFQQPPPKANS